MGYNFNEIKLIYINFHIYMKDIDKSGTKYAHTHTLTKHMNGIKEEGKVYMMDLGAILLLPPPPPLSLSSFSPILYVFFLVSSVCSRRFISFVNSATFSSPSSLLSFPNERKKVKEI